MRWTWLILIVASFMACTPVIVASPAPRSRVQGDAYGVSWFRFTPVTHNAKECIYGIDRVESYIPGWGALISLVTVGIATPLYVRYVCTARPDALLEKEAEDPFLVPPREVE